MDSLCSYYNELIAINECIKKQLAIDSEADEDLAN